MDGYPSYCDASKKGTKEALPWSKHGRAFSCKDKAARISSQDCPSSKSTSELERWEQ